MKTAVLTMRVPVEVIESTQRLADLRGIDRQDVAIAALLRELQGAPELVAAHPEKHGSAADAHCLASIEV